MHESPKPSIPYLLAYACTIASRLADAELRPHGLTMRQYGLLLQLRLEPELTMADLSRQLGVTRQSLHEMVGELERAGRLRRLPGASGRTRRLALEPATLELLAHAEVAVLDAETGLLGDLTLTEAATLRRLLQRLLAGATDDEAWL